MSISPVAWFSLSVVLAHAAAPEPEHPQDAQSGEADAGDTIEIVVETKKRPDWLFPGLDHPRVQAFFRSNSLVGDSLFDEPAIPVRRPLVRAGTVKVQGADGRAQRKAARRFARDLVADVRPALEACYADALQRDAGDAERLTFRVELGRDDRGPVQVAAGQLGDVYGNACVHGVLEFADVEAPAIHATVEIPVWFWLQTS